MVQAGQYMVVTDRWQRFSDLALSEATLAMLASSADEFLVHGVDVEGMRFVLMILHKILFEIFDRSLKLDRYLHCQCSLYCNTDP